MDAHASHRHPSQPPLDGRSLRRPVTSAATAAALVVCIYHIPGASVAADALRAALAGLACGAVLTWALRPSRRGDAADRDAPRGTGDNRGRRAGSGRPPAAVVLGLVAGALAGCAANMLAGQGVAEMGWSWPGPEVLGTLALSCLGTAAWEEMLFRRLLPAAFAPQLPGGRRRDLACACTCAGLFALLHLDARLGGALAAARFAQAALFGLVMAGVAHRRGGLAWAVGLHAAYDLACFVWSAGTAAAVADLLDMPAGTLLAGVVSPAGLAASIAVLAPLGAWAVWELGRGAPSGRAESAVKPAR